MTYYLVALDTVGIQPYLFGSNRLRENIGASEIVKQTTEEWVYEAVGNLKVAHNLKGTIPPDISFDETQHIEAGNLAAEVIYAGGGNAVLIFQTPEVATRFVAALTEKAILKAPGLTVVAARREFEWSNSLSQAYSDLMQDLARKKATRHPSAPLLGLGVTATCQSTGLPAVTVEDPEQRRIAAEVEAKLRYRDKADDRLERLFGVGVHGYEFAKDFNQLGTRGEASYIAVVHADGNGIGQRIEKIKDKFQSAAQNRDFIREIRRFSGMLKEISTRSLQQVVKQLRLNIRADGRIVSNDLEINLKQNKETGNRILPLRPLVVGGDDTTFVCDGRLGLSLAAVYLQAFRKEADAQKEDLHACAGVAVVHNHFPFARAYDLSEALCGQAKSYVRDQKEVTKEAGISALDWHFSISGLLNDLSTIRQQEYTVPEGNLCIRPVRLSHPENDWGHAWQTFREVTLAFQREWADKRSKLKALREPLRNGPAATAQFLRAYDLADKLPKIGIYSEDFQKTGWSGKMCGYFDAIEAADYFIDLENDHE